MMSWARSTLRGAIVVLPLYLALSPAGAAGAATVLKPAPLGQGQCQAVEFADHSVQAQIAVEGVSCAVATGTLGPAADRAQGANYTAAGFSCRATPEGVGSAWASAWGGTYYAYNCAKGAAQAAFNWGRDYVYGESGGSSSGSSGELVYTKTGHHLLPAPVGDGMCQAVEFADHSVQAQIAVYGTSCTLATGTLGRAADEAKGAAYTAAGFTCKATAEGPGSEWASAWGGTYYAYTCAKGADQAGFNWGRDYTYGGASGGSSGSSGSLSFTKTGHHLLPAPVGDGMCQAVEFADHSVQGQIAVYGTSCTLTTGTLGPAADRAHGAAYTAAGFSCRATPEGAGSAWASAWGGTYYAYSCAKGAAQAAFNWGRDYTY